MRSHFEVDGFVLHTCERLLAVGHLGKVGVLQVSAAVAAVVLLVLANPFLISKYAHERSEMPMHYHYQKKLKMHLTNGDDHAPNASYLQVTNKSRSPYFAKSFLGLTFEMARNLLRW